MTFNNPLKPEQYRELKKLKKRWDAEDKHLGTYKALRKYFELHGKLKDKQKFKLRFFKVTYKGNGFAPLYSDFTIKMGIEVKDVQLAIQYGIKKGFIRIARNLASGNNIYEWVCS